MNEGWLCITLVSLYISGWLAVALSEESKIWRNAYDDLLTKHRKIEDEMKHLKALRLLDTIMENENRLE